MILVMPPSVVSTQADIFFSGGSGRRVFLIAAGTLRERQYSTDNTVANALPPSPDNRPPPAGRPNGGGTSGQRIPRRVPAKR
jgi:hypothetical protein